MYFKGIENSLRFWIPLRVFQIPGAKFRSLSVELEFKIPIFSEILHSSRGIPDPKAVIPDPRNKILPDFRFHKQKFPGS